MEASAVALWRFTSVFQFYILLIFACLNYSIGNKCWCWWETGSADTIWPGLHQWPSQSLHWWCHDSVLCGASACGLYFKLFLLR